MIKGNQVLIKEGKNDGLATMQNITHHRRFLFLASESLSRVRSLELGSDSSKGSM